MKSMKPLSNTTQVHGRDAGGIAMRLLESAACAAALVALFLLLAATSSSPLRASPRKAEGFRLDTGGFEIHARIRKISAGGFPNTTMNPFRKTPVHAFAVHHRGEPLVLDLRDGGQSHRLDSFSMVYQLVDAPEPAILVPAGGFHLLTEGGQAATVRALGALAGPSPLLQWLDGDAGQPAAPIGHGLGLHTPDEVRLRGGRWLLLSRSVVLDVRTLRHYPVRPWIASGSGRPMSGLNASVTEALAFSPHATQYVALGSGLDDGGEGCFDFALLVVDIPTGDAYGVALPPALHADVESGRVDRAWIRKHFRWRGEAGAERLESVAPAGPGPARDA